MIINETDKYSLYEGNGPATGLYNLTEKKTNKITHWFDIEEASKFLKYWLPIKNLTDLPKKHIYYE